MWICASWIIVWVVGYWCLTLLGWRFLAPLMTTVRQAAHGVGAVGLVAALLLAEPGERPILRAIPLLIGLAGTAYAYRNQWLRPRPAVELELCRLEPPGDAVVAILAGGEAVVVSVLSRVRTAVRGNTLLVHCGLARSLAAFARPGTARPAALLPHATGFEIGAGEQRWDGVDGKSISGGEDLAVEPLALSTYSTWRAAHPLGALLAKPVQHRIPPGSKRTPRVPGSGDVEDPLAWGHVEAQQWTPLEASDWATTMTPEQPRRYLGRWAAAKRGLSLEPAANSTTAADDGNSG
jgi:hypothetical protein